jgi:adenylate cyclase
MAVEIERKFRLSSDHWRAAVKSSAYLRQGYLANTQRCSVRVRLADGGAAAQGWLSVKAMTPGMTRSEYEADVPAQDAREMLEQLCEGAVIEKWRHIVQYAGRKWEIDEFLGENAGLIVAEIELESEQAEFRRPDWLGEEVTHDVRYYNFQLAQHPFCRWPAAAPAAQ